MPADLLASARAQAEHSAPPVRAAALLRIARVESATDPAQARRTFESAWKDAQRLRGEERETIFDTARLITAAIAPDRLRKIPGQCQPQLLCSVMLDHRQVDHAFLYATRRWNATQFPFGVVVRLLNSLEDESRRRALIRRALQVMREAPNTYFMATILAAGWKALPAHEALTAVRDLIRTALAEPDRTTNMTLGSIQKVAFVTQREYTLFHVLHIARHLHPPLAEWLVSRTEELAAAARVFPDGLESIEKESPGSTTRSDGWCFIAGSRDRPFLAAFFQALRDGNFGPPFERALEDYRQDPSLNHANRARCNFRWLFYHLGKREGPAAALHLDRVPDPDLRLFAQIELAAALAGLPELR